MASQTSLMVCLLLAFTLSMSSTSAHARSLIPRSTTDSSDSTSLTSPVDVWKSISTGLLNVTDDLSCKFNASTPCGLKGYSEYLCKDSVCSSYTGAITRHYYDTSSGERRYYTEPAIVGPYCWFQCELIEGVSDDTADTVSTLLSDGVLPEEYVQYVQCSGTVTGTSSDNAAVNYC